MLDQNGTAILVAIVGVLSTILGSASTILGNQIYFRKNNEAEKKKTIREKAEDISLLTYQVKYWSKTYVWRVFERKLKEYNNDEDWHDSFSSLKDDVFWLSDDLTKEPECPIDKIEMLINLYIPSLEESVTAYRQAIIHVATIQGIADGSTDAYDTYTKEILLRYVKFICSNFEENHKKLQCSLRKYV